VDYLNGLLLNPFFDMKYKSLREGILKISEQLKQPQMEQLKA